MQRFNLYLSSFCLVLLTLLCVLPAKAQRASVPGKAVKLDTIVNSGSEEIMPLMAPDRKTLYFVRSLSPKNTGGKDAGQDVWMAEMESNGLYKMPVNLGLPIDNEANNAVCGISPDGNTLYLTNVYIKNGKRMEPGVSFSKREGAGWSAPQALVIQGLTIQRGYLGAYMCPDEKTLLLTMKSEDAVGREDIYVSFAQADGKFSKPLNLGKTINTLGFEISPFYTERDSMLYFSTNGRKDSYGDADVYRVKRQDETWTKWGTPENMGPQVNSDGFDAYLQIAHDSTAFFCKEDPDLRFTDIYTVLLQDPQRNKELNDSTLAKNGKGGKNGKAGKNGKKGTGDDEEEDEESRKKKYGTDKDPRKPEEIFADLAGRKRKTHSNFESILFDFGSSKLRPEGKKILDEAVAYMKQHPTQGVEFVGHTDSVSGELVNQILSDKRSFAAKEYLMRKGVSRNRILNHGFGKQIYVAGNESDRGRQRNRRCEINLLIDPEEFRQYYQKEDANINAPSTAPAPIPGQK